MNSVDFRFGLLGRNISYSISPDIFDAILRRTNRSGSFELIDLDADAIEVRFAAMRTGYHGLSVTIPHKQLVTSLVDDLTDAARAIGAVNSIRIRHGKTVGGNTDVDGFLMPLESQWERLKNSRVLILGNGGSARAVVYALTKILGVGQAFVLGRDPDKLADFERKLQPNLPRNRLTTATELSDNTEFAMIVNCTPLGGYNHPDESPLPDRIQFTDATIYYDLNYNRPNSVVDGIRRTGHIAVDGGLMLVGQAVASFQWWTSIEVDARAVADDIFSRD